MNVNKKLDRLRQWGKEKMGGDKSSTTEEFKALEMEMNVRHEGMERLHSSMNVYIKSLTKRTESDGKDKFTPVGYLGSTMTKHGEVYEEGNKFGECLINIGQANERIARMQDSYASSASSSWLDALERSLAQMKDYQNARKKLESRRLAYDTTLGKIQKAKKEDFKTEEDLRSQKAKYEESTEEVYRRMQDIIEAENENSAELYTFLEAELNYHDRAREVLLQLKREWPLEPPSANGNFRSRTNTLERFRSNTTTTIGSDELEAPALPYRSRGPSAASSPSREIPGFDFPAFRPSASRNTTTEQIPRIRTPAARDASPASRQSQTQLQPQRLRQRALSNNGDSNVFSDPTLEDSSSSPDKFWENQNELSSSPGTSYSGTNASPSRNTSWSALSEMSRTGRDHGNGVPMPGMANKKVAPPPPPPSRNSKPKPPPPPMKRSALSTTSIPSYNT